MRVLKRIGLAVLVVAVLGGAAFGAYKYKQVQRENERLRNPQEAAKAQTDELVRDVGKIVQLPDGETPTVATVVDAGKLKSQAFFKNSENGDKVLMYTKALKAYLYRPSTKKIIEIAPISLGQGQTQQQNQ